MQNALTESAMAGSNALSIKLRRDFKRFEKTLKVTERLLTAEKLSSDPEDRPTFYFGDSSSQRATDNVNADLCDLSDILDIHDQGDFWLDYKRSNM